MKWLTVSALAMFLLVAPRVEAAPFAFGPISFTTDSSGLVTQVFFDEFQLSEVDEIAAAKQGGFFAQFVSSHIPEVDGIRVFLLEPGSTPDHPVFSDMVEIRHTFSGITPGTTEVGMVFLSDVGEMPLDPFGFGCATSRCVVETGDIQDVSMVSTFRILIRSDVPEPATLDLLGIGLVALASIAWRRHRRT